MTTQSERSTFRNEDLVLNVTTNIDPTIWDESRYEAFLDELCQYRGYQKEAIRTTLRYILGQKYSNLRELASENFNNNDVLKERFGSLGGMEKNLQLPDQIACSLDMATATGKSYVLYGIAAILLAEGAVDRVLVLCPSNTIEDGLISKFKELASNSNLRDLIPLNAIIKNPKIINASESIVEGSICIENYHAILESVHSSIRDSLIGKGERVAVLNDEAHHVANESGTTVKKWKEFLLNPDYGFKIIVGVSGTCYVGDNYFSDVISRYSLRKAIEERFVKKVEYVAEMPTTKNNEEKWQLFYNRHQEWKKKLENRGIKPLSIIVTKDIKGCKQVAEELQDFLCEWEHISREISQEKVLPVTSAREHQVNLSKLKLVDSPSSKVEWIVSVSMLSEGWDVKNVFQIVPHEERAFNSKLLIAQVLGRGLRKPLNWEGEDPIVTVFNHDKWSGQIKHLVDEILEIERRITSSIDPNSTFNFDLYHLNYEREEDTSEYAKKGEYRLFDEGYIELPSQVTQEDVDVEFERAVSGERVKFKTQIKHKTWSIEEVAEKIYQSLKSLDEESKDAEDPKDRTNYAMKFPVEKCEQVVRESLRHARITDERITDENRQKFLQALGTLRRKSAKRVIYRLSPRALKKLNTSHRQAESCSAAELHRGSKTIFFPPNCENTLPEEQQEFFREIEDPDGEFRRGSEKIDNASDYKTSAYLTIADQTPERKFVRLLCNRDNARKLDAWLKNSHMGFYSIEYAWKKGEHPKRGEFSPDFFIKQDDCIFIVEIKGDEEIEDPSPENIKKCEYALQHFSRLNERLKTEEIEERYQFNMLSPRNYNIFFQKLRDKQLRGFRSELDVAISERLRDLQT